MNKNLMILPSELDVTEININNEIEQRVIQYNKSKIRKETEIFKNKRKIETNDDAYKLTQEEKEKIAYNIINSDDTKNLKIKLYDTIKKEKEDYLTLRTDLYNLNQINDTNLQEYINIEKLNLYSFDKLPKYNDILQEAVKYKDNYYHQLSLKQNSINKHFENITNSDTEELKYKALNDFLFIKEMYSVNKETDDLEIFDKYEYNSNIDFAENLSEVIRQTIKPGDKSDNFLNQFNISQKNNHEFIKNNKISNKILSILLSNKFISSNKVTCFETMFTITSTSKHIYATRTLAELLIEITNDDNFEINKDKRQQIYMTYDGTRPSTEQYHKWNGLQIYDLDLKKWIQKGGNIDELKNSIHNMMIEFNWYLWICKSASGNGLHIYTKIAPPVHYFTNLIENEYISKYIHRLNYLTKRQILNDILFRLHNIKNNNIYFDTPDYGYPYDLDENLTGKSLDNEYLDNSVGRITSGIRLAFDTYPLVNENFIDLPLGAEMVKAVNGFETYNIKYIFDTISTNNFYNSFVKSLNEDLSITDYNLWLQGKEQKSHKIDYEELKAKYKGVLNLSTDLDEVKSLNKSSINYVVRYNVCNTLAALFGKDGLPLAHAFLNSKECKNIGEINSFYSCAITNRKEVTKLGLEILRKNGIIKQISEELQVEVTNSFKDNLKDRILQVLNNQNDKIKINYSLGTDYLSHIKKDLDKDIIGERINIILSPAGSGKTEFIKQLSADGKRVLLALPYVSIIKSKIENDPKVNKLFDTFYGSDDIKQIEGDKNVVTTFDKLSRTNYEKISRLFDYVFIDESHLLFTSSYRIDTTSALIKKIKDLYYLSNNDPYAAKIVLLTGTSTGEENYFKKFANVLRITKNSHKKNMEFLICDDNLDAVTRLASKAKEFIEKGYCLMIPTNKGELYSEKLVGMIEYLLQRPVKYGYYKRSNIEQEICQLINTQESVGDYDIVFCSNYLSVGVDINDTSREFASIYLGNFSAFEIEQFNARIRKKSIESIYCVITQKSDNNINEKLLEEPNLILRMTDEDNMNYNDDKSIAAAKTEFIATYDPVLKRITTPGFSLLNGKIQFNMEEYELITFENKFSETMQHPIKVAKELSKYGYDITISTEYDGLSKGEQELLKKMGLESMQNEKIKKHGLLVGTFIDLINKNNFTNENGLEFFGLIEWIQKNPNSIIEDRDLNENGDPVYVKPIYDVFATPLEIIVRSKEALDKMIKSAKYLSKKYSEVKAINIIMQYVNSDGILKQKYFQRSINLLKLIDSSEANELTEPISRALDKMYNFVDKFEIDKNYRIGYETWSSQMDQWVNEYIDDLGIKISTKYGFDKIKDGLTEMICDLATRQTSKNGIRFNYNKLPEQDSTLILNRQTIDNLVQNMFKITENVIVNRRTNLKGKHIILTKQEF